MILSWRDECFKIDMSKQWSLGGLATSGRDFILWWLPLIFLKVISSVEILAGRIVYFLCVFFFLNLNVEENNLGPKIIAVSF